MTRCVKEYGKLTSKERKEFIDLNVKKIVVHKNHVEINYI